MKVAPSWSSARRRASSMWRVEGRAGACSETMSAARQQIVQRHGAGAQRQGRLGCQERVVQQHVEIERAQQLDHPPADARGADDADHLAEIADRRARQRRHRRGRPLAPIDRLEAEDPLVGEQDGGEGELGDGQRIGRRGVGHLDAAREHLRPDQRLDRAGGMGDQPEPRRRGTARARSGGAAPAGEQDRGLGEQRPAPGEASSCSGSGASSRQRSASRPRSAAPSTWRVRAGSMASSRPGRWEAGMRSGLR